MSENATRYNDKNSSSTIAQTRYSWIVFEVIVVLSSGRNKTCAKEEFTGYSPPPQHQKHISVIRVPLSSGVAILACSDPATILACYRQQYSPLLVLHEILEACQKLGIVALNWHS